VDDCPVYNSDDWCFFLSGSPECSNRLASRLAGEIFPILKHRIPPLQATFKPTVGCTNFYANVYPYIVPFIAFFFPCLPALNNFTYCLIVVYIHYSPGERGKNLSTMPDHIYHSVLHVSLLLAAVSKLQRPINSNLLD
jgi:hypothetical protein